MRIRVLQMNIGTWTVEQLLTAVGQSAPEEGTAERKRVLTREKGGVGSQSLVGNYMKREWIAHHPLQVPPKPTTA